MPETLAYASGFAVFRWLRGRHGDVVGEPEPLPELLAAASRRPGSTLERQITAPDRLPEARGADEASVYATGAVIDDLLLLLHRP